MSKEQINYLLALATLFIVWLYFNTFYVNAKKNSEGMPFGGRPFASGMRSPGMGPGFPQFPNMPELPRAPQLKNMNMPMPSQGNRGPSSPEMPRPSDSGGQRQQGQ